MFDHYKQVDLGSIKRLNVELKNVVLALEEMLRGVEGVLEGVLEVVYWVDDLTEVTGNLLREFLKGREWVEAVREEK